MQEGLSVCGAPLMLNTLSHRKYRLHQSFDDYKIVSRPLEAWRGRISSRGTQVNPLATNLPAGAGMQGSCRVNNRRRLTKIPE